MSKFAYAKNITYDFSQVPFYEEALQKVTDNAKKDFEADKAEFEELLKDGDIESLDEYHEAYGGNGADFTKSFEENIDIYKSGIEKSLQGFLAEVFDLPQNCTVELDDSKFDKNGRPDTVAVQSAIMAKNNDKSVPIAIVDIASTKEASKSEILLQKGYDSMNEMIKSQNYKDFITLGDNIKKYSASNIALIYAQKPTAVSVMSFNQWKEQYNRVPSGKGTGINILAPSGGKALKSIDEIDKYVDNRYKKIAKEEGKPISDYKSKIETEKDVLHKKFQKDGVVYTRTNAMNFFVANVFDVSDTKPLDPNNDRIGEIMCISKPLEKDMRNYDKIVECMQKAATLAPINFDDKVSQQEALYSAIKDYSKEALDKNITKIAGAKSYSNGLWQNANHNRLLEAESIISAYLISKNIGIECDERATFQLAQALEKASKDGCISKRELFEKAYNNASKLAQMFENDFDKEFKGLTADKGKVQDVEFEKCLFSKEYNTTDIDGEAFAFVDIELKMEAQSESVNAKGEHLEETTFNIGTYSPNGQNPDYIDRIMDKIKFMEIEVVIDEKISFHLTQTRNLDTNDVDYKLQAQDKNDLHEIPLSDADKKAVSKIIEKNANELNRETQENSEKKVNPPKKSAGDVENVDLGG